MSERQKPSGEGAPPPNPYSPERVRQGEIILRRPWQRAVFIAGLAGAVLLGVVLALVSYAR